jgi:tetratricopeptide (TPR) repeat protein
VLFHILLFPLRPIFNRRQVSNLPYNGGYMFRVVVIGLALLATAGAQTNPDLAALQQVIEMHKAGDYAGAIAGYQQFLKAHPEVSSVRSNLGAALAHEARFDEAIREYGLALDAEPSNTAVRLNLALAYYKSARVTQALEQLEKVHQAQPDNRQALLLLAASYLHTGQNKKIIELLDPVAKIGTKDLAYSYLLGSALIRDHQPERGQAWLDDILHNADSAEARLLMGTAKLMANDLAGARVDLTRAE